ncbi:MAG: PilZ domain-containing protein [bacterium]|nr:PilZ domain-containing protein [bacterium]
MARPPVPGQAITLRIGARAYRGRVREVTFEHVVLELLVDLELKEDGAELYWENHQGIPIDLDQVESRCTIEMRVPLASFDHGADRPDHRLQLQPHDYLRAELRRSVRIPAEFAVTLAAADGVRTLEARSQDVSHGGIRLEAPSGLLVGEVWQVTLHLPTEPVLLLARVVRRIRDQVYALRFLGDPANGQRVVRAVFEALRANRAPVRTRHQGFRRT